MNFIFILVLTLAVESSCSKIYLSSVFEAESHLKVAISSVIKAFSKSAPVVSFSSDAGDQDFLNLVEIPLIIKNFNYANKINNENFCIISVKCSQEFEVLRSKLKPKLSGKFLVMLKHGVFDEIENIFRWFWSLQVLKVIVMTQNQNSSVLLYTFDPFSSSSCQSTSPILVNEFKNGKFRNEIETAFEFKTANYNGCEVRVATSNDSEPYVFAKLLANGSYIFHGRDIELVQILSKSLNFRINFTYVGEEGFLDVNGSSGGQFTMLLQNRSDLIMADFWLVNHRLKFVDASVSYFTEKYAFMIPPGAAFTTAEKFIKPLDSTTWILLLVYFGFGFVVIFVFQKFWPKKAQKYVFGVGVKDPHLNLVIAIFGGSQTILPTLNFGRFLLMIFLLFCLIMRTLYCGSLFEFLRTKVYHKEVQSIEEIIEKDYKIYFLNSSWNLLSNSQAKLRSR